MGGQTIGDTFCFDGDDQTTGIASAKPISSWKDLVKICDSTSCETLPFGHSVTRRDGAMEYCYHFLLIMGSALLAHALRSHFAVAGMRCNRLRAGCSN